MTPDSTVIVNKTKPNEINLKRIFSIFIKGGRLSTIWFKRGLRGSRVVYADVYPAKSSSTHGTQRSSVFHRQARPQQHAKGTSLFSPPMKSMPLEIMPVTLLPVQLGVVTETLSLRGKNYDFRANKPRP